MGSKTRLQIFIRLILIINSNQMGTTTQLIVKNTGQVLWQGESLEQMAIIFNRALDGYERSELAYKTYLPCPTCEHGTLLVVRSGGNFDSLECNVCDYVEEYLSE